MGESGRLEGHCLCDGVALSVPAGADDVSACHCGMCRRWGGGPALVLHGGTDLRIERGADLVARYPSSEWAERVFCSRCGSHLFYRSLGDGGHYVASGLFDALPDARFNLEIFVDAKPGWYDFANQTERLTEAEFLARIGVAG
ncbi:GFA family protein [Luteimonas sp. BDR2-5]|uniref:GFA family protein n=1 Tax=Proluteimonas luteida TaxID=2878685 RepID=UPI001E2F4CCB|nr:GFA family protein [Luteimonas sp. BDR2-5]MCD9028450.1 GFA family protein [Luteimonas sp. BDR2-5]